MQPETTTVLLEAANFEPVGILPDLGAARAAHRGLEPLGEGRRSVPRRAGRRRSPRELHRRARRRALDRRHRRQRATSPSGRSSSSGPERADAADRARGRSARASSASCSSGSASSVAGRLDVTVPTWRARDVTREADLVEEVARFHLRRGPVHAAARARMQAAHARPAAAPRGRGRARRRRLLARRTRRASSRRTPTRTPFGCPIRCRPSRRPADDAPSRPRRVRPAKRRRRQRGHRPVRDRPRLPAVRRTAAGRALASSAASPRAASARAKGVVETLYGALHVELRSSRAERHAPPPGQGRARRRPAGSASSTRLCSRGLGRLRARPRRALRRRARTPRLRGRDHLPGRAAGSRVRRRRGRARRRSRRRRSRGRRPELRELRRLRRLPRRAVPEGRKSIAFRVAFQSPERTLSDEDARRVARADRRGARRALRRRAAGLDSAAAEERGSGSRGARGWPLRSDRSPRTPAGSRPRRWLMLVDRPGPARCG